MEFYSELNKRRKELLEKRMFSSNCAGTALYLVGERGVDLYTPREIAEMILNRLTQAKSSELGYLASWESNGETLHLAVVVNKNPLKLAEREGYKGPFNPSKSFTQITEGYSFWKEGDEVKYYIPSKLQKILEKEGELK